VEKENDILFAGDPHGDFSPLIKSVLTYRPKAVVLLGDYDLEMPFHKVLQDIVKLTEVWWIAGNHDFETPDKYKYLFRSELIAKNLHLTVNEVAGLRIAGLGGIFMGRVWYPPTPPRWYCKKAYLDSLRDLGKPEKLTLKHQCAIWYDEMQQLKHLKADILVTHEAPESHRHGFAVIGELARAMEVKKIFHGHLHENYTRQIAVQIQVCGVANRAVSNLAGNILP
jgi:predicted phosphodiesterase